MRQLNHELHGGAHLQQISPNEWIIEGIEKVIMRHGLREGLNVYRWSVIVDRVPRGSWSTADLALAHAYALATGKSGL